MDEFVENYVKEFGLTNPTIKAFDGIGELKEFVQNSGLGQARCAVFVGNDSDLVVFTRAKTQNVLLDDSAAANSILPRLHHIASVTYQGNLPVDLNYTVIDASSELSRQYGLSAQITTFSYVFLILGIGIIALLGQLKEKRTYEYLVVSGLNRVRFFLGSLGYVLVEMVIAVITVQIFFVAFSIINTSPGNNFLIPIFLLPSAISFCGSFGLFSFATTNTMGAMLTFFTFVGFIPSYLMIILVLQFQGKITSAAIKYLYGIVQIFLPGIGPVVALQQLSAVAIHSQIYGKMTFGQIINYSDMTNYPLWVSVILSTVSGVVYFVLAVVIDQCGKWLSHPTTNKFLSRGNEKPLEDH